jgi:hypothetical protein
LDIRQREKTQNHFSGITTDHRHPSRFIAPITTAKKKTSIPPPLSGVFEKKTVIRQFCHANGETHHQTSQYLGKQTLQLKCSPVFFLVRVHR